MIKDIYVLNKNLQPIGIVDGFKSCIWANRYNEIGDCEIYIEASVENLKLLKKGYYLIRENDDDMVCRIKKVEIDTNSEEGNYLIVTAYDCKDYADQRIIWNTMNIDGNVESAIREMVDKTLCNPDAIERQLLKQNGQQLFYLGDVAGFTETTAEQISYKIVGEKIREYCKLYGWGYKVILLNQALYFLLYKGIDRSNYVVFSDDYENLQSSKYVENDTNLGNVALIGGEGEGSERTKEVIGNGSGVDRYEKFIDARDISKNVSWSELTELYPTTSQGGRGSIVSNGNAYAYKMSFIDIQIIDNGQLIRLKNKYPNGQELIIDGDFYYRISNIIIANLDTNEPNENTTVTLCDVLYSLYLLNRGSEKLAEYGSKISFEGSVEPNTTFEYKKDYFIGDLVNVENEYGISLKARISEVIEIQDDNGYSIEPKFEYIQENDSGLIQLLVTENNECILTEDEEPLEIEKE